MLIVCYTVEVYLTLKVKLQKILSSIFHSLTLACL